MVPIYEYFGKGYSGLDWSECAMYDLYHQESFGSKVCQIQPNNGYAHGKKMLSITVAMWKEDLYITLWPWELYEDPNLPDWWLNSVFKRVS